MDRDLLNTIESSLEAIRQGQKDASWIGMTREEYEAIQSLLDQHYASLDAQRSRIISMEAASTIETLP